MIQHSIAAFHISAVKEHSYLWVEHPERPFTLLRLLMKLKRFDYPDTTIDRKWNLAIFKVSGSPALIKESSDLVLLSLLIGN